MALSLTIRRPARRNAFLLAAGTIVAAALLVPIVVQLIQANDIGWHEISRLLFRRLTRVLLINSLELAVFVSAAAGVLGTGAAYLVERTTIPGRRIWAMLLVVPFAVPDFVVAYSWHSIAPGISHMGGAVLVMSLQVYPLVYLPVSAALRRADPSEEEVARSLGLGPIQTFFRVTVRQIRPALTGGCLVVCLVLLAEFGAFSIMGFQTFTTTIYAEEKHFNPAVASGLSLVLVLIGMIVLASEGAANAKGRVSRSSGQAVRMQRRHRLTPLQLVGALAGVTGLVGAALGVPIGTLIYWMQASHGTTLPGASMWGSVAYTATYSAAAALIATVLALPVALLGVRFRSPTSILIERSTYLVQSLPGIVIAGSLIYVAHHYVRSVYQHAPLLIAAYSVMFFPLALICVRASVAQAPRRLEEVARSLGRSPIEVLLRVVLPLVGPGLAAGFCLVFLSAVTELTATLLLVPTGARTLATQFWYYQSNTSYGAAAPYAVAIVALAAVPTYVLTRWFDRHPGEIA